MATEESLFSQDGSNFDLCGCCSFIGGTTGDWQVLFRTMFSRVEVEEYLADLEEMLPFEVKLTLRALNPKKNSPEKLGVGADIYRKYFVEDTNIKETRAINIVNISLDEEVEGRQRLLVHTALRYLWSWTGQTLLTDYFELKKYVPKWDALMIAEKLSPSVPPPGGAVGCYGRLTTGTYVPKTFEAFQKRWKMAYNSVFTLTSFFKTEDKKAFIFNEKEEITEAVAKKLLNKLNEWREYPDLADTF